VSSEAGSSRPRERLASPPATVAGFPVRPLVPPEREAHAFWRMRLRLARARLVQTLRAARFRLSIIFLLSGVLWGILFWLFYHAFDFLQTAIPAPDLRDETVQVVFGTFFVALMVMLVFSSAIILYSSLFRAGDVALLLTLPARPERIFLNKFQEAILMSSWAFLLLGSPMLLAYGLVVEAPWYFFAMLVPCLGAFVYIPGGIGALACLIVVHRLPKARWYVLAGAAAATVVAGAWGIWSLASGPQGNILTPGWFQSMLDRLRITEHRLLPSWWLSAGLFHAAQRNAADGVMFLALLIANALWFRQLAVWTAAAIYRSAYSRLHGRRARTQSGKAAWIDRALLRAIRFLPPQVRLLLVKDLRLFRRDPEQWSQSLIFVALLIFYFLNVRRLTYDASGYGTWVNLVSFLNVAVVGLLLSTFTTRFVFPMVSLEGRRFWFLGLLPVRRETILWSKFALAVGGAVVPSCLLILLSDAMLQVDPLILISHQVTGLIFCFGLSGIAVGLGATIPNLRELSPSRIAAGFGGTLNLVLSTLYILAIVLLTAIPSHFYLGAGYSRTAAQIFPSFASFQTFVRWWLIAGTGVSLLLGVLATVVPLWLGFRAFRRLEF
jgi:ABC-2 type transport system permease protein